MFTNKCKDTSLSESDVSHLETTFKEFTDMDLAIIKECTMNSAQLYQLGINVLAAHTCPTDIKGLADLIKRDSPAQCQENFCQQPSAATFKLWCLNSTLQATSRPTHSFKEKSFAEVLQELENKSSRTGKVLFSIHH